MKIYGVELIEAHDMVIKHQRDTGKPFESESVKAWVDACENGGTALDIGAYTGLYSLLAAKNGAESVAFEPNKAVFERLMLNIYANDLPVHAIHCAIGAKAGTCSLTTNKNTKLTSAGKVTGSHGDIGMYAVDDFAFSNVCAIKIDTEGFECAVLIGASETIRKCKPVIITEALTGQDYIEQKTLMSRFNYYGKRADERNVIWRPLSAS